MRMVVERQEDMRWMGLEGAGREGPTTTGVGSRSVESDEGAAVAPPLARAASTTPGTLRRTIAPLRDRDEA